MLGAICFIGTKNMRGTVGFVQKTSEIVDRKIFEKLFCVAAYKVVQRSVAPLIS